MVALSVPLPPAEPPPSTQRVLSELRRRPEQTAREISLALGITPYQAAQAVSLLHRTQRVGHLGKQKKKYVNGWPLAYVWVAVDEDDR